MVPGGNLTNWQVQVMIGEAIKEYDILNTQRHKENTEKLDRMVRLILGTLLTACASLAVNVVAHLFGK
jgi:hypothetical protein